MRTEQVTGGPDPDALADDGLRAWVDAVRASGASSAESVGVVALREAQRARKATRPAGPAVAHVDDVLVLGRISARLYRPTDDPRPVVVFAHGGGFVMGDLESHDSSCRRLAVTADVTVLSVDYRLAPEHPAPAAVEDVCDVYRWAARRPDLFGDMDMRSLALAGDSSGGAIALLAAADLVSAGERPRALLLAYPNADLTLAYPSVQEKGSGWGLDSRDLAWFVQQWVPDPGQRSDPTVSPLHADLTGLPTTVVATAQHDPLRDEGTALAGRLRAAAVPVEHLDHPGLVHGFLGLGHLSPAARVAGDNLYKVFGGVLHQNAERDRQLDAVLIGGREPVTIVVVDYDPEWPARFEQVSAGIHAALEATALRVEHIGSTSVPGLAAKPIVDVLLIVPDVEKESAFAPALEASGLALRVREPGHRMFRTPTRDVHVHVYGADDQAVADYLDLRDWLRVDEADRALYADVKRHLAQRSWSDMNHYADAKSEVITQILDRARVWRGPATEEAG